MQGLLDSYAIVVVNETHVGKGRFVLTRKCESFANDVIDCFGSSFIRASESKIVNLAEEENFDTAEPSRVNGTIVRCAFKVEFRGKEKIELMWLSHSFPDSGCP